jgi:hypothetical protein
LADKLGSSLPDINLLAKSERTASDPAEQGDVVCQGRLSYAVFIVHLTSSFHSTVSLNHTGVASRKPARKFFSQ